MNNLLLTITELANRLTSALSGSLGVWYLVILNAFGVVAIICKICEYQVKKRNVMFTFVTIACVCWVLYFVLYGNLISGLTCFISVIRMLIFMQRGKHAWADSILWLVFFLVLQVLVTVFTVKSWLDIFTILAGFLGIFAYFVTNATHYRILSFFHMALWVVNSAVYFYPIALISDSFSTISCGVAICRYDLVKRARSYAGEKKADGADLSINESGMDADCEQANTVDCTNECASKTNKD